jgi:flavin reductase (DIM6/NTAB) family NADH-FMN oxidoreductase RutF/rubredoxin
MNTLALTNLTYGVFVLASKTQDKLAGCIINCALQTSSNPPTIAVCVNRSNFTNAAIKESGLFSVSILSEAIDPKLIGLFGFKSSKDIDKFAGLNYEKTSQGLPILSKDINAWLACKVIDQKELSSHTMFFGETIDGDIKECPAPPMTYAYYHKVVKGKVPPTAPTYVGATASPARNEQPASSAQAQSTASWRCKVCGYVYDGSQGGFEALPSTYQCPLCGVSKDNFELVSK